MFVDVVELRLPTSRSSGGIGWLLLPRRSMAKALTSLVFGTNAAFASLLVFAFFNPRVLGAHGGAGYTFRALAILALLNFSSEPPVIPRQNSEP